MSNNKTKQTLEKMVLRLRRTLAYCEGQNFEEFQHNLMLQEACVFNVLQIGELSKNGLDEEFIQAHPEIVWRQIYGMRNRIAHDYDGMRLTIIWQTITEDFPALAEKLEDILTTLTD